MKKFLIERKLPGAGNLRPEELKEISKTSVEVATAMDKPYNWIQSFVTEDAIFCVHEAEDITVIIEHSNKCDFPYHVIREIKNVFGPETATS